MKLIYKCTSHSELYSPIWCKLPSKIHDKVDPCEKQCDPTKSPVNDAAVFSGNEADRCCHQRPDNDVVETE